MLAHCLDGSCALPAHPPWAPWVTLAQRSRPLPGLTRSGDAWIAHWWEGCLTVGVIDGLGHGDAASDAAALAVDAIASALHGPSPQSLDQVLYACDSALHGSRGAVIALCTFELSRRVSLFCGVGNIALVTSPAHGGRGVSFPGTLGGHMRTARVFESSLRQGDLFVLHSDGISSTFALTDYDGMSPESLVEAVESDHGKAHDDLTVVAVHVHAFPQDQ